MTKRKILKLYEDAAKDNGLDCIHFETYKEPNPNAPLPDYPDKDDDFDDDPNAPFSKETAAILGFMPTDEDFEDAE